MLKYMYTCYEKNCLVLVYDTHKEYIEKTDVKQYLHMRCQNQGSSFQARKTFFMEKMLIYKFVPLVLSLDEIFFPIQNIKDFNCIWVHYASISKVQYKGKECTICFSDHTLLHSSYGMRIKHTIQSIEKYIRLREKI